MYELNRVEQHHSEDPPLSIETEHEPKRRFTLQEAIETESELVPESIKRLFVIVVSEHPELRHVKFEVAKKQESNCSVGFYEFEEGEDGLPVPVIFLEEQDAKFFQGLIDRRLLAVVMHAESIGLPVEQMTPDLLRAFIIAHELGHISDYLKNYLSDPDLDPWEALDEMSYHRQVVLRLLPGVGEEPRMFARRLKGVKTLEEAARIIPGITRHPSFSRLSSVEELIELEDREYRESAPESYADQFAADLIRRHADVFIPHKRLDKAA